MAASAHSQTEIAHRERDFARISRELAINDFKPGSTAANIPSRFDCAFLLGDLNFRLDLSRLHCDWLMQNKDYRSAMAFDQLRPLTSNSASAFHGWSEGEITFAPTYKCVCSLPSSLA